MDIENINAAHYEKAPTTVNPIKKRRIQALMDTGAEISCIRPDAAVEFHLQVDNSKSIAYSDVNGQCNRHRESSISLVGCSTQTTYYS
jgi:hypothetical protein